MKIITFFFLFSYFSCLSQGFLFEHEWIGELYYQNQWHYIKIKTKDGKTNLQLPDLDIAINYPLKGVQYKGAKVEFQIMRYSANWRFQGALIDDSRVEGYLNLEGNKGIFRLHRRFPLEKKEWQAYLGYYITSSGKIIKVWDRSGFIRIHSPFSQTVRAIKKIGDKKLMGEIGEAFQFSDLKNQQFQQLERIDRHGQTIIARRFEPFTTEEVTIYTRKDTIRGTFFLPNRKGKNPACIIALGAGSLDRTNSLMEAELFASYGIATLAVDRPGTGKSSGNIRRTYFDDKQGMTVDLYNWVKKHPKVDPKQIGFSGGSQGGRIAIMAASEIPQTAFLILRAHPVQTFLDTRLYAIEHFLRGQNYEASVICQASNLWRQYYHQVSKSEIDTNLLIEIRAFGDQHSNLYLPPIQNTGLPATPAPHEIYSDPVDYLSEIKCPILSQVGELDRRVPVHNSLKRLQENLESKGHQDHVIIKYAGANHSFVLPGFRITSGYLMDQVNWLLSKVRVAPL